MHTLRLHGRNMVARMISLDVSLCLLSARLAGRRGRAFFAGVSRLGDGWWWGGAALARLGLEGAAALEVIVEALLVPLVGVPAYLLLKRRTARPRPCAAGHGLEALVAPLDEFSFPSGHTQHAVAFTLVLGAGAPLLMAVLATFALLVALSRVVLGLHYPTDVVAGALLGVATATAVGSL